MSKLRGVMPEKIEKRLKLFLYGPAGIGKTISALKFPKAYIIDTEKGSEQYNDTIKESGSVVFHSNNIREIRQEIEALLKEKHEYRTLIIDPITTVYSALQEYWTAKFEKAAEESSSKKSELKDFGQRYWGKVKPDYKSIQRSILKLDMNVIVTAHQKDLYGDNMKKIGITFDSEKGDEYFFDHVFRLEKRGKERFAIKQKERSEPGKNRFPDEFVWSYENFQKYYGTEILEKKAEILTVAAPEQIQEVVALIEKLKVNDIDINKWFDHANCDGWNDMPEDKIKECIEFYKDKLKKTGEKK